MKSEYKLEFLQKNRELANLLNVRDQSGFSPLFHYDMVNDLQSLIGKLESSPSDGHFDHLVTTEYAELLQMFGIASVSGTSDDPANLEDACAIFDRLAYCLQDYPRVSVLLLSIMEGTARMRDALARYLS
jgi:hypothetical protein